jgi:hypothetical protein
MKPLRLLLPTTSLALLAASQPVRAQFVVSSTDLHPAGTTASIVYGLSATIQVGTATVGQPRASLWSGSAGSWVNLNPTGASSSTAAAVFGTQQAGYAFLDGGTRAGIWTGSAASFIDLHPTGAFDSLAVATIGTQQGGYIHTSGTFALHAGLWSGTAGSFIDLHPAGSSSSQVSSLSATQQGGSAVFFGQTQAGIWTGSSASWVSLHPDGAGSSSVYATTGTQQAGVVDGHASIWTGTAGSWLDLNPAGASRSTIWATTGTYQVGFATFSGIDHAGIWSGTAGSWFDLGPGQARSIITDGTTLTIGGQSGGHATVWTATAVPEPAEWAAAVGLGLLGFGLWRRRAA